ncbi:MAG TPA: TRAP transporter small permease [Burkholderiales bacterium]|nr:TRAP transporter small permease [Burkholderiales bacterium]
MNRGLEPEGERVAHGGPAAGNAGPRMRRPLLPPGPAAPLPIGVLGAAIDWAVVALGAAMVALVFVNVVFHVFGRDVAWTTELCEFMMVWVTFLGGAAATRRGAHMRITEFLDKLSGPPRRLADAAVQALALVVLGLLVWFGLGIVAASRGNILTVLDWPMAWQYLSLPVGSAATFVFVAWDLAQILRGVPAAERYGR